MIYTRPFRYLVVLVLGMIVGTVVYRYGEDATVVKRAAAFLVPKGKPLAFPSKSQAIPSNVVQMKQILISDKKSQRVNHLLNDEKTVAVDATKNAEKKQDVKGIKLTVLTKKADVVKVLGDAAKISVTAEKPTEAATTTDDDNLPVPRIVHYTWYSGNKLVFRFHHFISVLSAYKHIKPKKIMLWYEIEPQGPWWIEIRKRVPVIELMYRKGPTEIFGRKVDVSEHKSDIVRLEAIMKYGGIYTDLDVIITKSFDPLRKYKTTMGYESPGALCNGIIVSAPNAPFLKIWYESYRTFNDSTWSYHSVMLPGELAKKHPDLIHTEEDTMNSPDYIHRGWFYNEGQILDWSKKYSLHLWYRFHNVDHNPEDIKTMNTTLGQLFRYTYYGTKDLMP